MGYHYPIFPAFVILTYIPSIHTVLNVVLKTSPRTARPLTDYLCAPVPRVRYLQHATVPTTPHIYLPYYPVPALVRSVSSRPILTVV